MACLGRMIFLCRICLFPILLHAPAEITASVSEAIPHLNHIILKSDSVIFLPTTKNEGELIPKYNLILNHRNNSLSFELFPSDTIEYQYYLLGFDKKWTSWKNRNIKEYTNLPAGHYVFQARYRGTDMKEGEISSFSLKAVSYTHLRAHETRHD